MRFFVFALAIAIWVQSGPLWGQAENHTNKADHPSTTETTNPKIEQRGTKNAPFFVYIEQGPQKQTDPAPTTKSDAASNRYDRLTAWSTLWASIFTGGLVLIGAGGVYAAVQTLKAIKQQTKLQTRSIELQERQMQQWVEFVNWKVDYSPGLNPIVTARLTVSVDIINPTAFPMTLDKAVIQIGTIGFGYAMHANESSFLPPRTPYIVKAGFHINEATAKRFMESTLKIPIQGTVSHHNIIIETVKPTDQTFTGTIECGEQFGTRVRYKLHPSPYPQTENQEAT